MEVSELWKYSDLSFELSPNLDLRFHVKIARPHLAMQQFT
jgi:hypothetical protein